MDTDEALKRAWIQLLGAKADNARKRANIAKLRLYAEGGNLTQKALERLAEAEQELQYEEEATAELERELLLPGSTATPLSRARSSPRHELFLSGE